MMNHEFDVPHSQPIMCRCPVCGVVVPFAHIDVTVEGTWRPRIRAKVTGDATDFVAHLWTHRKETAGWVG